MVHAWMRINLPSSSGGKSKTQCRQNNKLLCWLFTSEFQENLVIVYQFEENLCELHCSNKICVKANKKGKYYDLRNNLQSCAIHISDVCYGFI